MWCPQCQADVAAVLMPDHRHSRCTHCGMTLAARLSTPTIPQDQETNPPGTLPAPASFNLLRDETSTRNVRDVLARWSTPQALESLDRPFLPDLSASPLRASKTPAPHASTREPVTEPPTKTSTTASNFPKNDAPTPPYAAETLPVHPQAARRVDLSHGDGAPPKPKHRPKRRTDTKAVQRRFDQQQSRMTGRGPHFDVRLLRELEQGQYSSQAMHASPTQAHLQKELTSLQQGKTEKPFNWGIVSGQVCAYLGVALLTCGTSLVLWSHFGGPVEHAPTGWLMTTAGQMLLFLGVVTLVSSGMEQTTDEVATRIQTLGEKILRLEIAQRESHLQAPHYARKRLRTKTKSTAGRPVRRRREEE